MTVLVSLPLLSLGLALAPPEETKVPAADGEVAVKLKARGQRRWKIQLPREQWSPVGTGLDFQKTLGHRFPAKLEGTRLLVDGDGDGKFEIQADGKSAWLTLLGKDEGGAELRYSIRVRNEKGWQFAPGGFVQGEVAGTRIRIIDQNNNGRFNDIGRDAMVIGRGRTACFLSEVVSVAGKPYQIHVAADGTELRFAPYKGDLGVLDLACTTKGKVLSAIVKSTDGKFSFDLAEASTGLRVPAASYMLYRGELGLGENRVQMRTGRSQPIVVGKGKSVEVCWGGPVRAEFAFQRVGDQIKLSPDQVWYFGAAGEIYENWLPIGKSPNFVITNTKTGKEVAQTYFPGSC